MNVLSKVKIAKRANDFKSASKATKPSGLVAQWKVTDGKLICQWHKV